MSGTNCPADQLGVRQEDTTDGSPPLVCDLSGLFTAVAAEHLQSPLDLRHLALHPRKSAYDLLTALPQGTYQGLLG